MYESDLSDLINKAFGRGKLRFFHTSEVSEPLGGVISITTGTKKQVQGEEEPVY